MIAGCSSQNFATARRSTTDHTVCKLAACLRKHMKTFEHSDRDIRDNKKAFSRQAEKLLYDSLQEICIMDKDV
jgi:hypothetical protein